MLNLNSVTLFAIDCVNPGRTMLAMRESMKWVKFRRAIILTDTKRNQMILPVVPGVEIVHLEESDRKESPFPGHPAISIDYDRDILTRTVDYCLGTHLLHVEWDSCVLNPSAWDQDWLRYDFIGAPWPPHEDPGWPACNESNNVGNFGFCLGSWDFWNMCKEAVNKFKNDPALSRQMMSSDRFICRSVRPWMEKHAGIRFAPEQVAARFSAENVIYSGQFGFHGANTVLMNNWSGRMFDQIKQKAIKKP